MLLELAEVVGTEDIAALEPDVTDVVVVVLEVRPVAVAFVADNEELDKEARDMLD